MKIKAMFKSAGGFPEYTVRIGNIDLIIPENQARHVNINPAKSFGGLSEMEVHFNDPHVGEITEHFYIGRTYTENKVEIFKSNFEYKYVR